MTTQIMPRVPIEYLDRPPPGWFVLDVMKINYRKTDWAAIIIDVDPDDFVARPEVRAQSRWLKLGKHKSRDDAWDHADQMLATRH